MSSPIALTIGDEAIAQVSIDQVPSLEIQKPESKVDINIFYVDDDKGGLDVMVPLMIGTRGFNSSNVTVAQDAVSALEILHSKDFHIMIFDGHIGDSWGWDLLAQARQAAAEQGRVLTPYVALYTGDSTRNMRESALLAADEQGMTLVGEKDLDNLLETLDGFAEELLA